MNTLEEIIFPLSDSSKDYKLMLDTIKDARIVLIGEASHGTHEFYIIRSEITKHLIMEKGFNFVAIEGDWPDTYRINGYVCEWSLSLNQSLEGFKRFPTWMWRNKEMVKFLKWLREYNASLPPNAFKAHVYGLDLYSLHASINAVLSYLEQVDPEAARRAQARYSCLDLYYEDMRGYAYDASLGLTQECEESINAQLKEMQQSFYQQMSQQDTTRRNEYFLALQNAKVIKKAEEYYRSLVYGNVISWNLRDEHMMDVLDSLISYYATLLGKPCKAVVWAHNSHIGDARVTRMGATGQLNLGQLVRERYGNLSYNIGFTTYKGTVAAASDWDGSVERKNVVPALSGSYEDLFNKVGVERFFIPFTEQAAVQALAGPRLHRAIGVIYRPETELHSHYFTTDIARQYNSLIHINTTKALHPLDPPEAWPSTELPEAFPSGL